MPRAPDPGAKTNLRGVAAHAARWGGTGRAPSNPPALGLGGRRGHTRRPRELAGAVGEVATPCTDGRPSENTPPWLALHQSSLPNAAKRSQTYILYSRMAFFEIEWAPQRPVAAPPACPRPPRGHGTSPRPSGMLGLSITPFTRAVLRRASRRAAQRSAQSADHKTDQKTAVATPALATAPQKALARRQGLRVAQAAAEVAVRVAARVASRPQRHGRRARSRLDEIDEEDEEEEDYSNLDEDSGEEQDSETGQGSEDDD